MSKCEIELTTSTNLARAHFEFVVVCRTHGISMGIIYLTP